MRSRDEGEEGEAEGEEKNRKTKAPSCTVRKYSRLMVLYASACLTSPDWSFRVPGKAISSGAAWINECTVSAFSMRLSLQ